MTNKLIYIIIFLAGSTLSYAQNTSGIDDLVKFTKELNERKIELEKVEAGIDTKQKELKDIQSRLEAIDAESLKAEYAEIKKLKAELAEDGRKSESIRKSEIELKTKIAKMEELLKKETPVIKRCEVQEEQIQSKSKTLDMLQDSLEQVKQSAVTNPVLAMMEIDDAIDRLPAYNAEEDYASIEKEVKAQHQILSKLSTQYKSDVKYQEAMRGISELYNAIQMVEKAEYVLAQSYNKEAVEGAIEGLKNIKSQNVGIQKDVTRLIELLDDYCVKNVVSWIAIKNCNRAVAKSDKERVIDRSMEKAIDYPHLTKALKAKKKKIMGEGYHGIERSSCK